MPINVNSGYTHEPPFPGGDVTDFTDRWLWIIYRPKNEPTSQPWQRKCHVPLSRIRAIILRVTERLLGYEPILFSNAKLAYV